MRNSHLAHPQYRADIDGLRALAVLSVVFFHAFPDSIAGGFIGVDVFFVISGFLISTIIFKSLESETFTFLEFYARRIRRIYPALLIVLLSTYVICWFTLLADEYKQLGKHIAGGAGFMSNFVLWSEAGYFDNSTETKPLLHLWSLGVEEQFYILWPFLLWLAWRKKFNFFAVSVVLALISFALNLIGVQSDLVGTFYFPQTRFWELLSGSILAWLVLYKNKYSEKSLLGFSGFWNSVANHATSLGYVKLFSNIMSIIGMALLIYGFCEIDKNLKFPGLWAIIPVLGSILIIAAGDQAWLNRVVLSNRIVVWFGLISFPLYLWHWPLISLARIMNGGPPSRSILRLIIVISIFLAWLTYIVIEKKVRNTKCVNGTTSVLLLVMFTVGALGYGTYLKDGFGTRINNGDEYNQKLLNKLAVAWVNRSYPRPDNFWVDKQYGYDRVGHSDNNKILFLGDSHTYQYWNTVGAIYQNNKNLDASVSTLFDSEGSHFPPLLDNQLIEDQSIKAVVFSYYWAFRYGSDRVNQPRRCCGDGVGGSVGVSTIPISDSEKMDEYDRQLINLIQKVKAAGKKVWIVLDNPFGEELDPHFMFQRSWRGVKFKPQPLLSLQDASWRREPVKSRLMKIANMYGVNVIDPMINLCSAEYCSIYTVEGEFLYKDYDHLSLFASMHSVRYLDDLYLNK
jgi:peptidoglycan/LPS O-acetylase OafA/YrhL